MEKTKLAVGDYVIFSADGITTRTGLIDRIDSEGNFRVIYCVVFALSYGHHTENRSLYFEESELINILDVIEALQLA